MDLLDLQYPIPSQNVFSRRIVVDWYDGMTSGLVASQQLGSFKVEIITWGPGEETRIFAFSRLADGDFDTLAELLRIHEAPRWPVWVPQWSTWSANGEWKDELDELWLKTRQREYVVAADSGFRTLTAAKRLDQQKRESLPSEFDGNPMTDNFKEWLAYLDISE